MNNNAIVVFCVDQNDVNNTFNYWVNILGYQLVSNTQVSFSATHYQRDGAGNYGPSGCTPHGQFKFVLVFEGN